MLRVESRVIPLGREAALRVEAGFPGPRMSRGWGRRAGTTPASCDARRGVRRTWGVMAAGCWCRWLLLAPLLAVAEANPDAKRLYDDLLSNYNRLIRPVSNNTDTVLVKLGLRLSQLIDLVSRSPSS